FIWQAELGSFAGIRPGDGRPDVAAVGWDAHIVVIVQAEKAIAFALVVLHPRAAAMATFEKPNLDEHAERSSRGTWRDVELARNLGLAGDQLPGFPSAGSNPLDERIAHLDVLRTIVEAVIAAAVVAAIVFSAIALINHD